MATVSAPRATWAARLGAALVVAVALAACADDEPSAAPSDASPTSEETAAAGTDELDRDESDEDEGTAEASGEAEATSDSIAQSTDPTDEESTSEDGGTDDGATIGTTPTATGDEPTAEVDDTVVPVPVSVPGPTVASDLEEEADFGTGVIASIVEVEAVEVEGRGPGERSGPGVLVTVEVDNDSTEPISLDFVTVDLIRADGASAIPVDTPDPVYLSGDLEPGASATGAYQFFIRPEERASATITVNYASGVPTALFSGDLPNA